MCNNNSVKALKAETVITPICCRPSVDSKRVGNHANTKTITTSTNCWNTITNNSINWFINTRLPKLHACIHMYVRLRHSSSTHISQSVDAHPDRSGDACMLHYCIVVGQSSKVLPATKLHIYIYTHIHTYLIVYVYMLLHTPPTPTGEMLKCDCRCVARSHCIVAWLTRENAKPQLRKKQLLITGQLEFCWELLELLCCYWRREDLITWISR